MKCLFGCCVASVTGGATERSAVSRLLRARTGGLASFYEFGSFTLKSGRATDQPYKQRKERERTVGCTVALPIFATAAVFGCESPQKERARVCQGLLFLAERWPTLRSSGFASLRVGPAVTFGQGQSRILALD